MAMASIARAELGAAPSLTCRNLRNAPLDSSSATPSSPLSRRLALHAFHLYSSSPSTSPDTAAPAQPAESSPWLLEKMEEPLVRLEMSRRSAVLCALASAALPLSQGLVSPGGAEARERRQRTDFPEDSYTDAGNGLRYLDVQEGKGKSPENGEQVKVHFEVKYGPLTVVSTRESKLLGGNRSISEPYFFILGAPPGAERKRSTTENANGLFSAQAAPKPPKALYAAVEGMKVGGKRSVLVPAELGYGDKGYNEIPPGAPVQLIIDLLDIAESE